MVFQWLCYEMERRVPVEHLREAMKEYGFTKEERCQHCNEEVKDWDFEVRSGEPTCNACEEECKECGIAIHLCEGFGRKCKR